MPCVVSADKTRQKFDALKSKHAEIMANLDMVKGATATILGDQEKDLLRAFRARCVGSSRARVLCVLSGAVVLSPACVVARI